MPLPLLITAGLTLSKKKQPIKLNTPSIIKEVLPNPPEILSAIATKTPQISFFSNRSKWMNNSSQTFFFLSLFFVTATAGKILYNWYVTPDDKDAPPLPEPDRPRLFLQFDDVPEEVNVIDNSGDDDMPQHKPITFGDYYFVALAIAEQGGGLREQLAAQHDNGPSYKRIR